MRLRPLITATILTAASLVLVGGGCASTTTTNTTTNLNTNTVTTNTTKTNTTTTNTTAATNTSLTNSATANTNDTPTVEVAVPATKTFDVTASQFEFSPSTITVSKGDTVVLNLTSEDVPHGFSLADFNISETLTPGKTKQVTFVADQVGTFSFSCSIVCGSGHSAMKGSLIVQ